MTSGGLDLSRNKLDGRIASLLVLGVSQYSAEEHDLFYDVMQASLGGILCTCDPVQ